MFSKVWLMSLLPTTKYQIALEIEFAFGQKRFMFLSDPLQ
jgi:hypothetical protein